MDSFCLAQGPLGPFKFDIGGEEAWKKLKGAEQAASDGQGSIEKAGGKKVRHEDFGMNRVVEFS
jgi:hypothetical protein